MTPKIPKSTHGASPRPYSRGSKSFNLTMSLLLSLSSGAAMVSAQETTGDEDVFELAPFVVEGSIRESLIEGIQIKRESYDVVDSLVAEDIGKFPDNNVVEALQRITGVQVTGRDGGEVSTVSIRGLNDIATTVNGRNVFTADGRSVALQDIPASLLNRVDVFKTRSAEHLEQGIAGVIDVKTQRPFYFDGQKTVIAARGIYQEIADTYNPNISALYTNTWDLDSGGKFGALFNLSFVELDWIDSRANSGAMVPFTTENPPGGFTSDLRPGGWGPFERIFPDEATNANDRGLRITDDPAWIPGLEAGLPFAEGSTLSWTPTDGGPSQDVPYYLSRDAVFANNLEGHRERPAANISLQFAPNKNSEYTFEAFYNGYRQETFNNLHFSFVDWWGGLDEHSFELYPGTNVVKSRENVKNVYGFQSGDYSTGKTDSFLYAIAGKWDISDKFKLSADLSLQDSVYETEFIAMRADRVHSQIDVDFSNDNSGIPAWSFGEADTLEDPAIWNLAQLYDSATKAEGDAMELKIDGEYNLKWGILDGLSFGTRYDVRGATYSDYNVFDLNGSADPFLGQPASNFPEWATTTTDLFDGRADVPSAFYMPNGPYIYDNRDDVFEAYGISDISTPIFDEVFDIEETTLAFYAMANFRTEIGDNRLDGQFGVRYVEVDTDMEFSGESANVSTDDLLPSFTIRYDWTQNFRTRFSYGETLRRPGFNDLNPNITYFEDVTNIGYGTASGGNPDLVATTSKNYDLSFEYYLGEQAGAVYTTFFKRDIEGLVVGFRNRITNDGKDYILSQPDNASNGELEGVEIGWVYFPEDLPGILDGFGLQASYTMLDSIQDIPVTDDTGAVIGTDTTPFFGVSDTSYSVVLAYEKEKWSTRLSYVWREDFLNNNEAAQFANPLGIYYKPQQSLDFQFTYNVSDNLKLTLDATNITDEIYQSYYEYPDTHGFHNWLASRTVAVGARYSF